MGEGRDGSGRAGRYWRIGKSVFSAMEAELLGLMCNHSWATNRENSNLLGGFVFHI